MAFWPGDDRGLRVPRGCPKLEDPPQPYLLGAAPGLAGRDGAVGDGGRAWRMGSGIDLMLALAPIKALSGKNVTKGHDFTALGGAQSFGIHSMSF